jgi:hypothetical protein
MLPAYKAFSASDSLLRLDLDGGSALFQETQLKSGDHALLPLEAVWQLGSPVAAIEPRDAIQSLFGLLLRNHEQWDFVLLSGMEPGSALKHAFREECERTFTRYRRLQDSERDIILLDDGVSEWMDRRSSGFRAKLRRADRKCAGQGIEYQRVTPSGASEGSQCFERLLAIEEKSWKADENTGLIGEPMRTFTREVLIDGAKRDELYVVIARDAGADVGFVYGAKFRDSYRGLQMTYAKTHQDFSLGNVLQFRMIEWMVEVDCETFDLGSALPYKARWSDERRHTEAYLVAS